MHDVSGGKGLKGWGLTSASKNDVWFLTLVIRSPVPDGDTFGAVLDGFFHRKPLWTWMLGSDDDVDVVFGT